MMINTSGEIMKPCPRCQKYINKTSNFCEHCGTKVSPTPEILETPEQVELWWKTVRDYAKLLDNKHRHP